MFQRIWSPAFLAGAILLGACAGGSAPVPAPTPENLAALEAAQAQEPRDAGIMTRLGIAYYDAKRYDRARDVLASALVVNRDNYAATVYLGLAQEELGQLDSARVAYESAAKIAKTQRQRAEIGNRLELLARREIRVAAQRAIQQESLLSLEAPRPNTIAVFPFRYTGSNPDVAPLSRGLTHLMITDLSKLSRFTLLERERVQALVDELALAEANRVDPATGARSGRLLRAAQVVQGSVGEVPAGTELRLDAAIVDATNARVVASGSANDQLQQLFQLEKAVLFRLVDQLGITLTPAERRALSERPTADLQAFLAFSRGLEAEDRGDYEAANGHFSAALARDPNFRAARERQTAVGKVTQALAVTAPELAGLGPDRSIPDDGITPSGPATIAGRGPILRTGVFNTVPSVGSTLTTRMGNGPVSRQPTTRTDLTETFGGNGIDPPLSGTIIIIITRP
jgi:TolB-like protein